MGHRKIDGIQAKPVHATREPEACDVEQGLLHRWIMNIEIGLGGQEIMQIILSTPPVPRPAWPIEDREPIIGRGAVLLRVSPDIPVVFRIATALPALLEPGVSIGSMGVDLVDDDLQA